MKDSRVIIALAALVVAVAVNANEAVVPVSAMAGPIEVRIDPNFELIAMVCHLAGYEEYALSLYKKQDRKLIKDRFGSFTNHPTVKAFKEYRKKSGIGYDAPAALSVHLKPDLSGYLVPLEPWPQRLDARWKKIDLEKVRRQLSLVLRGVAAQHLLPRVDGGRVPVCELLVNTMASANHIASGHSAQIYLVIETGGNNGMVTLDQSLERLVSSGAVPLRTALGIARYPAQLKHRLGVM